MNSTVTSINILYYGSGEAVVGNKITNGSQNGNWDAASQAASLAQAFPAAVQVTTNDPATVVTGFNFDSIGEKWNKGFTDPVSSVTISFSDDTSTILYFSPPPADQVGCFLGHMPVLTPTGYTRIDSLKAGDLVITETGAAVPIKTVRVRRMRPTKTNNPYVIPKGQFGATQDVLISPDHSVVVAGEFVKASKLGLDQRIMKNPFNYYNLELPEWANMRVAGVEVESMAPTTQYIVSMDEMKKIACSLLKKGIPMKKLERLIGLMGNEKAVIFCPQ
jgi:hypothetical protein